MEKAGLLYLFTGAVIAVSTAINSTLPEFNIPAERFAESAVVSAYAAGEEIGYGLLPETPQEQQSVENSLQRVNGGQNFYIIQYSGVSDYLPYSGEFAEYVKERQVILSNIGYEEVLPFRVAAEKGIEWKLSNQGNYNSCATFGFTNAYDASIYYNLALDSGQYYKDFNPMYLYRNTSGGSGGRTLSEILNFNFESGHAAADKIGKYPAYSGSDPDVKQRCCNAVKLESAEQAAEVLKAGLGVYIGNRQAVSGSKQNADGLRVAALGGSWSHSTAFIGYVQINGKDYYLWRNSHGARYTAADKLDTPADCCWMPFEDLRTMLGSTGYGGPFAILPESVKQ
ncbi:hypothetical protein FACS1894214_4370 [Planctomycetales bacterium]|nr:hypothetical protein FACS1894214_4370 [Planctomycetales bacterium]